MNYRKLLRVKQTQIEMVQDRGYEIPESELSLLDLDLDSVESMFQFQREYASGLDPRSRLTSEYSDGSRKLLAYFLTPKKESGSVCVDDLNDFVKRVMNRTDLRDVIIISPIHSSARSLEKITACSTTIPRVYGKSVIELTKTFTVQFFLDDELMYNPTRHVFVPQHIGLSPEEQAEFYRTTQVQPNQLPILKFTGLKSLTPTGTLEVRDPIVAYYGWLPGQVVKIIRTNSVVDSLVEEYVTFRVVSY